MGSLRTLLALATLAVAAATTAAYTVQGDPTMKPIGDITSVTQPAKDTFLIKAGADAVRVQFYSADIVRVWVAFDGNFTDDASEDLVVGKPTGIKCDMSKTATGYTFAPHAGGITLKASSSPLLFTLVSTAGDVLMQDTAPISANKTATCATVAGAADEYFFGGGMQNGRFSHKGSAITIATGFNWADDGHPNSVPFYQSSGGYGVYRNTWSPGVYDFESAAASTVTTCHKEGRFDGYYFQGDFKKMLGLYTQITGPVFMVPVYGLGLGDSDCYHNARHGNSTQVVLAVADKYRAENMPGAWFLPNDGYGCGFGEDPVAFPSNFTDLDLVVKELHGRGFYTGLWSSTGLPNFAREVKGSGVRIGKTDVGWIGAGYKYAFESVRFLSDGIETNSDGRRFIWTVEGWAGTHRYAVMWTGDDSGSFEYIRWQLATFAGTGFSAQAHVSGDIDGIFGGSPDTYTRDLQFKCLMTTIMTMSGWAANPDKQPWTYGEPHTSINRMYLKLKARLTPYFYTYSRVAHDTGVPPIRAMALEFQEDASTFVNATGTAYQFMAGESLLVAPVYEDAVVRSGIYLPAGVWYDYWTGEAYVGPCTVDNYSAPLHVLPLFVKSGAIIPMWPDMLHFDEKPHDPITLDVFPNGTTTFELYEDDGVTRKAIEGTAYAKTLITVDAGLVPGPKQGLGLGLGKAAAGPVNVTIGAAKGDFDGKLTARSWVLNMHYFKKASPKEVLINGKAIPKYQSRAAVDRSGVGWFFQSDQGNVKAMSQKGTVYIRTGSQPTNAQVSVSLTNGPDYPAVCLVPCDTTVHHQVEPQKFAYDATSGTITLQAPGNALDKACLTASDTDDAASHTPAVEFEKCAAKNGNQKWVYDSATMNIHLAGKKNCMDQDGEDMRVIMYGCGNKQTNQQWVVNPNNTQHIMQAHLKNYCMSVCASGGDAHAARTSEASMRRLRNDMYRRERNHP